MQRPISGNVQHRDQVVEVFFLSQQGAQNTSHREQIRFSSPSSRERKSDGGLQPLSPPSYQLRKKSGTSGRGDPPKTLKRQPTYTNRISRAPKKERAQKTRLQNNDAVAGGSVGINKCTGTAGEQTKHLGTIQRETSQNTWNRVFVQIPVPRSPTGGGAIGIG